MPAPRLGHCPRPEGRGPSRDVQWGGRGLGPRGIAAPAGSLGGKPPARQCQPVPAFGKGAFASRSPLAARPQLAAGGSRPPWHWHPHPPRRPAPRFPHPPGLLGSGAGAGTRTDVIVGGEPNPRGGSASARARERLRRTFQGIRAAGRSGRGSCALGFIVRVHCGLAWWALLRRCPQPRSTPGRAESAFHGADRNRGCNAVETCFPSVEPELPADRVAGDAGGEGIGDLGRKPQGELMTAADFFFFF